MAAVEEWLETENFDEETHVTKAPTEHAVGFLTPEFPKPLLFNKWSLDFHCNPISLKDHLCVRDAMIFLPHSSKKYSGKRFAKSKCSIVERLANSLMMHGRNSGKKLMAIRTIYNAFEIIHLLTNENPVQVLVEAIVNAGPREDSTRVGRGGAVRRQAVDVSPLRRVNLAIYNIATGARVASFKNIKTFSECLADEIISASKNSSNSFAIKKKDEVERVAKSNR